MCNSMIQVFLAPGFEEIEALATVDVLRRAGLETMTVAVGTPDLRVKGAHGIEVAADIRESEAEGVSLQALVLPGGMPGTRHLEQSAVVQRCLEKAEKSGAYLCAICAAPSILGHKGLLRGCRAICFPGFEGELEGAQLSEEPVVTDGRLITAKGAGVAVDFALAIVAELVSPEEARKRRESLQCR